MEQDFYLADSISNQRRFFGRRKVKPLSPMQASLYDKAQEDFFFDYNQDFDIHKLFKNDNAKIILEIGFGGGEHLLHQAILNPDINYIGIDAYITGVSKVVREIYARNIKNICLSDGDALNFIKQLPENSLDGVYLLYPDPWPKKRHRHRRFIQRDTAILIERILKPNGFFRFASDIPDYVNWVLASLTNATTAYIDIEQKHNVSLQNWISTRYEQKALRENRIPAYYQFFFNKNLKNLAINSK